MGWDAQGREVWHHTYYNPTTNRRISYDTVLGGYLHQYLIGTGHETDQNSGRHIRWDEGPVRSWENFVVRRN